MRHPRHAATSILALALAAPTAATLAQPQGGAPLIDFAWRAYETGQFPNFAPAALDYADLDGDRDLDVVVAHEYYGAPGLVVMENLGNGVFAKSSQNDVPYNDSLADVVLRDIDGDGHVDAIATVPSTFSRATKVYWWHGNPDGTFANPYRTVVSGPGPIGLVVEDFTGDGFPDILTADGNFYGTGNTVSLMVHNGQSGGGVAFAAPRTFTVAEDVQRVAAADLDGDTDLDIVVGRQDPTGNAVMFNDGAGNFSAPVFYVHAADTQYANATIALTDVDRDGDADLVATTATNGVPNRGIVTVRRNNGAGVFGPFTAYPLGDWSWTVYSLEAADVNGDGWNDLIATTPSGRSFDGFNVLLNDQTGSFRPSVYYRAAKWTFDAVAFDVDGDGDSDVVTAANDSTAITVHQNAGDGSYPTLPQYRIGSITHNIDQADIDRDGDLDIVSVDAQAYILRNNGDGTFAAATVYQPPMNPGSVLLRDMNDDGYADLVFGPDRNSPPYNFAVALNRGDGTFHPGVITPVGASQAGVIDAVDLNHDTIRDIVLTDPGPSAGIYVFRGNGSGTSFTYIQEIASSIPNGIRAVDLNHDTHPDLISSNALGITVWPGNGDFTFGAVITQGEYASDFDVADFDGDNNLDLAVLLPQPSFGTTEVAIMPGYGDGDFGFPNIYPGTSGRESAYRIAWNCDAADVDGDGRMDLVLTSNAPGDVAVFRGNGDHTLQPMERYGAGYSAHSSLFADFTGDDVIDVACIVSLPPGGFTDMVTIMEGFGDAGGQFALSVSGSCPGTIALIATDATPGATVAFIYAFGSGNVAIPSGPCAGTRLGLNASATLLRTVRADGNGRASTSGNAPPSACGRVIVQALDVSGCATSNVEGL